MSAVPEMMEAHARRRDANLSSCAGDLWKTAPAWKLLVASTSVLVVSAVLSPLLGLRASDATSSPVDTVAASPTPTTSCPIANWSTPGGEGTIVGFMSASQSATLLARTQASVNATINPAFVHNVRAVIGIPDARSGRKAIALVPAGMTVKPGDKVRYDGGYRDPKLPCNYVPPLISTPR